MENKIPHILMTGGGTLGPVVPLISIVEAWKVKNPRVIVSWIGTPKGPEREVIEERHETFYELYSPKLSREKKWLWPLVPALFIFSCFKALILLLKIQPDIIFTAGGFVSVPVVVVGRMLGIPIWVHQLDVVPGIANKIMALFAKRVSVTFIESEVAFPKYKTEVVGGIASVRSNEGDRDKFIKDFSLDPNKPTIFVTGGGTGAVEINKAMALIGAELVAEMNIIHLTGIGKMLPELEGMPKGYWSQEFMNEEIKHAYALADIVVSRAGLGTILDLIGAVNPTILIPIMGSHQERNAEVLKERGAAMVIKNMTPQLLKQEIRHLISDLPLRTGLSEAIGQAISLKGQEKIVEEANSWL